MAREGSRLIVLAVDGGSSSLKLAAYEMPSEQKLAEANVPIGEQQHTLDDFLDSLSSRGVTIDAIGHRIVFGAERTAPVRVTPQVLDEMERLVPFDPLHLRAEIDAVRMLAGRFPQIQHVLCFDTAFHQSMPEIAKRYPLPDAFDGVRRFGFHGLSLEYIVSVLGESGRTIVAHLGSGASVSAILNGAPLDTSMGFTPLGGIMMGTRPGDLDPGVLLYALEELRMTPDTLRETLTRASGMLGVSGTTSDMRELLERSKTDSRARVAIDLFVYIARKHVGALTAVLGGLDTLVFTGGIGEGSAAIRDAIAAGFAYLYPFEVRVIPTNEALTISRHVVSLLQSART